MDFNQRLEARLDNKTPESGPTNIIRVTSRIGKLFEETVDVHGMANGAVGLFRDEDGQAYEVQVRPAQYGQFKDKLGATRRDKIRNRAWQNKLRGRPDLPNGYIYRKS